MDIKIVHVTCVALTLAGFLWRSARVLGGVPLPTRGPVRVLPHVVDTILLASGVALVFQRYGGVFSQPWLLAKFAGVLAYIVLGALVLRPGRTAAQRRLALAGALAVFAWIVSVAHTRTIVLP